MANVSLSKLPKVNLSKNQVVSLTKDGSKNSSKLRKVFVGANWSAIGGIPIVSHIESTEGGFFSKLFGTAKKVVKEVVSSTSEIINVDKKGNIIDTTYTTLPQNFTLHVTDQNCPEAKNYRRQSLACRP